MANPLSLVSTDEVLAALGQNPDLMGDATESIEGAIERATIKLEGQLQTSLSPLSNVDTFYIGPTTENHVLYGRYRLLLENSLVRSNVAVEVAMSSAINGIYTVLEEFSIDRVKGVVSVSEASLNGMYEGFLRVRYTSGLITSDPTPRELRQALLCYVPLLIMSTSTATLEPKQAAAQAAKLNSLDAFAVEMLPKFLRSVGAVLKPLVHSEVVYAS